VGIIDDYLNPEDTTASAVATPTVSNAGADSVVSRFLNDPNQPITHITVRPKPPISGASKEQSDIINAQEGIQGGANPREGIVEGIKNLPSNLVSDVYEAGKSGAGLVGKGLSDITQGKPATGVGEVGLGALATAVSPITGGLKTLVERPVTQLTGNPDIGEKAAFVAGSGIPIVPAAKAVSAAMPENRALSTLVDKITSNGRDPQALSEVVSAMKADPRVAPADLSPAVLNMAQKLFVTEGDAAKNYLFNASKNRITSSKNAVDNAYDEAGNAAVNTLKKITELTAASKKIGADEINTAVASAKPVNVTSTIEAIDDILKPGITGKISGESGLPLTKVRAELKQIKNYLTNGKEMRTDAQDLHSFQSGLRRTGEDLLKSADGGSRQLGKQLLDVRANLVNDIDAATGGKYKPALSNYRGSKNIADAFHDAYNGVFTNSKKMENRPEFTQAWFNKLSDHEKEAAREGARAAIDTEIHISRNGALAGTNLGKSDFNQKRLEILFGKEKTEKLLQRLEHERSIANTHNKIVEGSQTEMRRAGDEAIALPEKSANKDIGRFALPALAEGGLYALTGGSAPGVGFGTTLALSEAAKFAKHKVATKLAKSRNLSLAKMAMPSNEAERQALIKSLDAIASRPPKQSLLRRSAGALTQVVKP
jgi:hypothetical protein